MISTYTLKPIAHIRNSLPEKFGIPRQSGLVDGLKAKIVMEPLYRNPDAFRELSGYSHIWLIWAFSESMREGFLPTVRPPRLGGNRRVGVFATRSPFRPNNLGLSCVKLDSIDYDSSEGPVLTVLGADLMDGTPIFDIKPYLPYVDSHPEASEGFAGSVKNHNLNVECPEHILPFIPDEHRTALFALLAQDPRPSYQNDEERIYGLKYADLNIRFRVQDNTVIICGAESC